MRAEAFVNQRMAYCVQERVLVIVESASALPKNGILLENSVNAMTETVTNMMALYAQEMVYVAVETVSAGMDGLEMLVKSGWDQNIPKAATEMEDWKISGFFVFFLHVGC